QQNHHIPGAGTLTADIDSRSGTHYGTTFQMLCYIALMIQLCHMTGCQSNLVAVRGVARGGSISQFSLGQLAFQGVLKGHTGVSTASETHSLMDIDTTRQGVTD